MQKGFAAPLVILGFIVLIIVAVGGFYIGKITEPTLQLPDSTTSPQIPLPVLTTEKIKDIVPIKANTVSFAKANDKIYLRYKGKIYNQPTRQSDSPGEINLSNSESYEWYGLVDSPIETPTSKFFSDELFDFKIFPDQQSFLFIMRWDSPQDSQSKVFQDFKTFYYDANNYQLSNPLNTKLSEVRGYNVPKIYKVSDDGKYVAFSMFGCWNCGGHQPETLLLKLVTNSTKRIGKVLLFSWKDNGNYEYKDYIVKECTELTPGECSEDPQNLPLKTGLF